MKRKKQLKELTLKDNFMFGAVMMEEENCRMYTSSSSVILILLERGSIYIHLSDNVKRMRRFFLRKGVKVFS